MISEPVDPAVQRAAFAEGVEHLGGGRAAARILGVTDRTVRDLCSGKRALHLGFLHDMTAALTTHADACRRIARRLDPLFSANRTADQVPGKPFRDRRPATLRSQSL